MEQTFIDIIRHGEPVGGRMYRGHRDDPLSEKGWKQMQQAVQDYQDWDLIVTSPLQRCADFAEQVAQQHNKPLQVEDRFKEIHWGVWEGKTPQELCAENPDTLHDFRDDPVNLKPEGAEDVRKFRDRVFQAWQDMLNQHRGNHILLVAHAGVVRAVISFVLETPTKRMFNIAVSNASITRIRVDHLPELDQHHLIFHNGALTGIP